MRAALTGGAFAGSVGAVVLAVILVLAPSTSGAEQKVDRLLARSGVVVVSAPSTADGVFDDPVGALRLAGAALGFGIAAGATLEWLGWRFHHHLLWTAAGFAVSLAVIAAAGRLTWRDAGAQFGFWLVAGALVARDVGARRPQAEC